MTKIKALVTPTLLLIVLSCLSLAKLEAKVQMDLSGSEKLRQKDQVLLTVSNPGSRPVYINNMKVVVTVVYSFVRPASPGHRGDTITRNYQTQYSLQYVYNLKPGNWVNYVINLRTVPNSDIKNFASRRYSLASCRIFLSPSNSFTIGDGAVDYTY